MTKAMLTSTERRAREDAVRFAAASVALEGFKVHPEDEEFHRLYIAGEITIEQAIEAVHADLRRQRRE